MMMSDARFAIVPVPFEAPVRAFATTRVGGVSTGPYEALNLGDAGGDDPAAVDENRRRLASLLPSPPKWLRQVHGSTVVHLDDWRPGIEADAAWTDRPGTVAAVLTADCLPVLLADGEGRCVAAAHAGWRGLAAGVLEVTVAALPVPATSLQAWIGPAIGPTAYEVDAVVREAFPDDEAAFAPARSGHWWADLPMIAEARLRRAGVPTVTDCGRCTATEARAFFSHRRDRETGRQASLVWIDPAR